MAHQSYPFVLVDYNRVQSQRDAELADAKTRSHAARISHLRRRKSTSFKQLLMASAKLTQCGAWKGREKSEELSKSRENQSYNIENVYRVLSAKGWDHCAGYPGPDVRLICNTINFGRSNELAVIRTSRRCTRCDLSHIEEACPSRPMAEFFRPLDGPYRLRSEQYLFKFFVEVAGATVSRSNISTYYWLGAFPQIAYETQPVRDCLLAVAATFHQGSGNYSANDPLPFGCVSSLKYQGRAMRSLSQGNPSTYEILNTAMAFWLISMVTGNWNENFQHLYHCLKIINGMIDLSTHDQTRTMYQATLAKVGLAFFRCTRGPCQKHGPGDFLTCDAECFTPEEKPCTHRIADAVHHMKAALPILESCLTLLQNRRGLHVHQAELKVMLDKEIREMRYLVTIWSDASRLRITPATWAKALAETPYTTSPFDAVLPDLIQYIVNDQNSTGVVLQELELRMRVMIPHIVASTWRGDGMLFQESRAFLLCIV